LKRKNVPARILVLIVAFSYFVYGLYWFVKTSFWMVETSLRPGNYIPPTGFRVINSYSLYAACLMDYAGFFGLIARVAGGFYALLSAYLFFQAETDFFTVVRGKLSKILFCEAAYFLSLVPSVYFLLEFSALPQLSNILLSAQLFTQIVLISPLLILLGLKIRGHCHKTAKSALLKWTAFLFLSYSVALLVSYLLKWVDLFIGARVTFSTAFVWLLASARLLSFLNTTVILSLSVVFALLGTTFLIGKNEYIRAAKYWSLSAVFLGLFFLFYVLYCAYIGVLWVVPFGELWMIPFLGVGLYFLLRKPSLEDGQ
jgi:predicted anti-sigma-YlaC factor YlaD